MDQQNPNPAGPGAAELTASQVRGLAMLGGMVDQLGAAFAGGAGAAATGAIRRPVSFTSVTTCRRCWTRCSAPPKPCATAAF